MDFEEYWRNGCFGEYHDIYAKNLAEQFYNDGQQSKQEEVNKLQKKVDELQKRINEAMELLEYNEYTDSALQALDVLRGE